MVTAAEEKMVCRWLEDRRTVEYCEWLKGRIDNIVNDLDGGYGKWEQFCIEVHHLLRSLLTDKGYEDDALLGEYSSFLNDMTQIDNGLEILSELVNQGEIIADRCYQGNQRTGEEIVEEVKRHIQRNYEQDISLQWISQQFFIHSNYFCRLFKEKTGMNLTDYITQVRMAQAYKLVKTTSMKIRDIAEMVGYDNPAYFSMIFRKTFQQSPVQVRGSESSSQT